MATLATVPTESHVTAHANQPPLRLFILNRLQQGDPLIIVIISRSSFSFLVSHVKQGIVNHQKLIQTQSFSYYVLVGGFYIANIIVEFHPCRNSNRRTHQKSCR